MNPTRYTSSKETLFFLADFGGLELFRFSGALWVLSRVMLECEPVWSYASIMQTITVIRSPWVNIPVMSKRHIIAIFINSAKQMLFLHISTIICYLIFCVKRPNSWSETSFDIHFPNGNWCWVPRHMPCQMDGHVSVIGEMPIWLFPFPFKNISFPPYLPIVLYLCFTFLLFSCWSSS